MEGAGGGAGWGLAGPGYDFSSARAGVAHLVERDLAKVEVAGSKPVSRSIRTPRFAFETVALRRTQMHQDAELLGSNFRSDRFQTLPDPPSKMPTTPPKTSAPPSPFPARHHLYTPPPRTH